MKLSDIASYEPVHFEDSHVYRCLISFIDHNGPEYGSVYSSISRSDSDIIDYLESCGLIDNGKMTDAGFELWKRIPIGFIGSCKMSSDLIMSVVKVSDPCTSESADDLLSKTDCITVQDTVNGLEVCGTPDQDIKYRALWFAGRADLHKGELLIAVVSEDQEETVDAAIQLGIELS